jgi:UDP-N-acetyl-D-mannosaminuronic acid dehydrogenase
MENKRICVVGLGYIGLPTASLLANRGYQVFGVDVVQETVDTINQGKIHIVEPDLDTFVQSAVNSGNLVASTVACEADIFIVAVPTPFKDGFVPNIDYIVSATKGLASFIKAGDIVILESTSPVGTTDIMEQTLKDEGIDTTEIYFAHCPERVLPGKIMHELVHNDRIVGGTTAEATKRTAEFYRTFVSGEVLETDAKTAEMAKLTENSFRDVNIAFANELSMLSGKFGIDVWKVIELANRHPRVNILQPGCGVGGHCIAVDPWFIVDAAKGDAKIIKVAREVNDYKTEWVIEKIKNSALEFEKRHDRKARVACMGLAFKADIDDLRESPALYIASTLKNSKIDILAVEPNIDTHQLFDIVDHNEAVKIADIIIFLVAHKEFLDLDIEDSKEVIRYCKMVDRRQEKR